MVLVNIAVNNRTCDNYNELTLGRTPVHFCKTYIENRETDSAIDLR